MDIQLSGYSGAKLCRDIKSEQKYEHIKIIASTANLIDTSKNELFKDGFDDIIFKPTEEADLINVLSQALEIKSNGYKSDVNKFDVSGTSTNKEGQDNLGDLEKFALGDKELLKELIEQFIADTEKDSELLRQALIKSQKDLIKDVLHRLSSRLAQVGAVSISQDVRNIEIDIYKNDTIPKEAIHHLIISTADFMNKMKEKLTVGS